MTTFGLKTTDLTKAFDLDHAGQVEAIVGVDLDVTPGEFLVIVGENGSGKSTFLKLISGHLEPTRGYVQLVGKDGVTDWTTVPRWKRAEYLAWVHQDPKAGTVTDLTVLENMRLVRIQDRLPSPFHFKAKAAQKEHFTQRLAAAGLDDKLQSRIGELSHGQRQLLAIEMALLRRPALLLLDEHTASLDRRNAEKCMEATNRLCRETNTTVLMVTHNLLDAIEYGDRLVALKNGRIVGSYAGEEKRKLALLQVLEMCGFDTKPTSARAQE